MSQSLLSVSPCLQVGDFSYANWSFSSTHPVQRIQLCKNPHTSPFIAWYPVFWFFFFIPPLAGLPVFSEPSQTDPPTSTQADAYARHLFCLHGFISGSSLLSTPLPQAYHPKSPLFPISSMWQQSSHSLKLHLHDPHMTPMCALTVVTVTNVRTTFKPLILINM